MERFTQKAKGKVNIKVSGDNHCGIQNDIVPLKYKITLSCPPTSLDSKGFLVDNTEFKKYFEWLSTQNVEESCEELCQRICSYFSVILGKRRNEIDMEVELSAVSGVSMKYERRNLHE